MLRLRTRDTRRGALPTKVHEGCYQKAPPGDAGLSLGSSVSTTLVLAHHALAALARARREVDAGCDWVLVGTCSITLLAITHFDLDSVRYGGVRRLQLSPRCIPARASYDSRIEQPIGLRLRPPDRFPAPPRTASPLEREASPLRHPF